MIRIVYLCLISFLFISWRESKKKKQKKIKAKTSSALSFNLDDEEVDEDSEPGNLSLLKVTL